MNRLLCSLFALSLAAMLGACAGPGGTREAQPAGAVIQGNAALAEEATIEGATPDEGVAPAVAAVEQDAPPSEPLAPTRAELDFADIYGQPSPDSSLEGEAATPPGQVLDPWEPFNRRMHAINNAMDRTIGLPLARAYVDNVPRPVRHGVSNVFLNMGQPVSALNALLQGRPLDAAEALARFIINTTVGVAGIFDPASRWGVHLRSEDFGQTLGVWGWERSRYLELPLLGPRTVRDMFGMAADAPFSPMQHIRSDAARAGLQGLMLVDIRTQLMSVDSMREGVADEYTLLRDAWMQRRNYQIHGDRRRDDTLPDYLQPDEAMPMVPLEAIPLPLPGRP